MKKRIVLSAGGTGGHLFPAQSLALQLPQWEVLFAAGGLGCNRYFDRERFAFEELACATFSLSNPLQVLQGCGKIFKGVRQSQRVLRRFAPNLVVGFGSYFTLPLLVAAIIEKIPFILHEQNTIPGKVNRLFSPFAHATAITFPKTRQYLKGKALERTVEVVFPLREKTSSEKEESWKYFGLTSATPTLLVFGGSQGAAFLNSLFLATARYLPKIQVLHFTGDEKGALEAKKMYLALSIPACVKAFEPYMDRAMQIADFAITRAGAATIAELIEYELPALLIPYPFATDNHQEQNGAHFASLVKGGKMYKENELEPTLLATIISQELPLLHGAKKRIAEYKNMRHAQTLADFLNSEIGSWKS
jgi:UDP-N-acetylglucosamine--N-acetylmuramyl-(pentapeptide) pyrophosphoryl-undecaprenol N-acetylglucosamine transferase